MVSVIIPNYNHASFLKQRIESVLNQTYPAFEIIILDDASPDNSKEVIESYRGHPKIKTIIYNQSNSGSPFKQWQKGIENSTGELIWIAESDDYAAPTFLEKLVPPFNTFPDLILAYCQSMKVNDKGIELGLHDWANGLDEHKWKRDYIEDSSVELKNYLSFRNTIVNASAVIFRRPSDVNILTESTAMKMLGDWLFWRKLLAAPGKIAYFSSPLNFFRAHLSTTRAVTTREKELCRMKEYYQLIVPEAATITEKRYDWMIEDWFRNRKIYRYSKMYFIPYLPPALYARFFSLLISKIKRKLIGSRRLLVRN